MMQKRPHNIGGCHSSSLAKRDVLVTNRSSGGSIVTVDRTGGYTLTRSHNLDEIYRCLAAASLIPEIRARSGCALR